MFEKIKKIAVHNYKWIVCFICFILFLALAEDVFNHDIMKSDIIGYKFISTYLINDSVTPIVKCITWFGSAVCLIIITVFSFFIIKDKKDGILIAVNLITIAVLNQLFKFIFQRPRPTDFRLINETGYSFPSGHSMTSTAFYGFLIYLIYKNVRNEYLRWGEICLLFLLIISIGISRIYLGVHYTSDVLAGFFISISYLMLYINFWNKLLQKSA